MHMACVRYQHQAFALFSALLVVFIPTTAKTQEHSLWKDIGLYGGQITTIAVEPGSSKVLYAGSWGGDGLFKSTDGGKTWTGIPEDNPAWFRNYEVNDIAVDPNNPETLWVADNHFVDVSRDAGKTWQTFFFAQNEHRFCYTVAVDPHDPTGNTVYVGTGGPEYSDEYGEIFVTRDGGITWNNMNLSGDIVWHNFWKLTFNPNKTGEIWIANRKSYLSPDGMIIVSPDNGASWWYWDAAYWAEDNTYYLFGYIDEIAVNPEDYIKIFASSQYGVARKPDGSNLNTGWIWTSLNDSCRALCIPASEPNTLYAALVESIARTTDDGLTWDTSRQAPAEFLTLQADPHDSARLYGGSVSDGIFISSDTGTSWLQSNIGIRANTIYDTSVATTPYGKRIVCGTLSGVYRSDDGATWQRILQSSSNAVLVTSDNPDTIYAGLGFANGWAIYKTKDGGQTWKYISADDGEDSKVTSIAVINSDTDNDTVLIGVSFSSHKKGQIIQITGWGLGSYEDMEILFEKDVPVNAIAVHPKDRRRMLVGTGSFYAPVAPGGLYRTEDGGNTWIQVLPLKKLVVNSIAISPENPEIVYAGCGSSDARYEGIYKSMNGGITWTVASAGLPAHYAVRDIKSDPIDSSIAYAALYKGYSETYEDLGGTYVTLDGGSYWTRIGLSDYRLYDIHAWIDTTQAQSQRLHRSGSACLPPSSTLYAGTASGMYQASTAGTGIVTGSVTSSSGLPIDGALIMASAGCGGQSVQGYYMVMIPAGVHSIQVTAAGYMPVMLPSVTLGAGQSIEQNIIMTPAGDNGSTCLATRLFSGPSSSNSLDLLRRYRDNVLIATPAGRFLINSYYSLGPEVWQVLEKNSPLRERATSLLARACFLAERRPDTLPPVSKDLLSSFLFDIESCAPPQVRQKIRSVRCSMRRICGDELGEPHP